MLFYLGEFAVDEQKLSEYKAGNGIRPSSYEICTSRIVYNGPRAERKHENVDSSRIAVSHIDHIIGKDGANLGLLWESFPVTVYLKPISLR
ncbi:unnamed protein product [Cuscuta campestris]|uniref:K Homology domain-containing protein n=1 Tax=Cuscuta campestris TaxID=132261 RepID=A0A484N5C3_9ASTE|nr:unnamed protein product [Cuscuta campestris]